MYLQEAGKNGPAKFFFKGSNQMSECYEEAIRCLKERYHHPGFFQEQHICSIVDAVPVKNGNNKELHHFYDAAIQHHWALKAAKADLFEKLLTVIVQQKAGQKHTIKVDRI